VPNRSSRRPANVSSWHSSALRCTAAAHQLSSNKLTVGGHGFDCRTGPLSNSSTLRSSRQNIVHHRRCDGAAARDVSDPPAGLQDQHAALERHRDRTIGLASTAYSDAFTNRFHRHASLPKTKFAADSPLEGDGFELPVPAESIRWWPPRRAPRRLDWCRGKRLQPGPERALCARMEMSRRSTFA
jgi:hypothetical protein